MEQFSTGELVKIKPKYRYLYPKCAEFELVILSYVVGDDYLQCECCAVDEARIVEIIGEHQLQRSIESDHAIKKFEIHDWVYIPDERQGRKIGQIKGIRRFAEANSVQGDYHVVWFDLKEGEFYDAHRWYKENALEPIGDRLNGYVSPSIIQELHDELARNRGLGDMY